ncbi:MAG TPA: MazG family protein [Cellulomonas sp.]
MAGEAADPFRELVAVMDRLRSPGGCPWDAAQTHASLLPYLLEESHELAEAVDAGDRAGMREELGDVLLQVVFHARLAQEDPDDPFDVDDVARELVAKLVRRHPHVFAGLDTPAERLHVQWDAIKKAEMGRDSALDGIPGSLPALARAQKIVARAQRAGLDVRSAAASSRASGAGGSGAATGSDAASLGERLLALALEAHDAGLDAEGELRRATGALERTLREREQD